MNTENLPLSVQDWPVHPGHLTGDDQRRYIVEDASKWCNDRRHAWYCTRAPGHELPHVAVGGARAVAVWDQFWFGATNFDRPIPLSEVPKLQTIDVEDYRRVTGADR